MSRWINYFVHICPCSALERLIDNTQAVLIDRTRLPNKPINSLTSSYHTNSQTLASKKSLTQEPLVEGSREKLLKVMMYRCPGSTEK